MKTTISASLAALYAMLYASFLSLGFECVLVFLVTCIGNSLENNKGLLEAYPRLIPFCVAVGYLALFAIILLMALNIFTSIKLNTPAAIWSAELICACVLSIPMIKLWELVFDYLRINF